MANAAKDQIKAEAKQKAKTVTNDEVELAKEGVVDTPVEYDVDPELKGPKSDEEVAEAGAPLAKDISEINFDDPQEGDAYTDSNGDLNVFQNGAWNIFVHHGATTF